MMVRPDDRLDHGVESPCDRKHRGRPREPLQKLVEVRRIYDALHSGAIETDHQSTA
jgi:hypothetical protein